MKKIPMDNIKSVHYCGFNLQLEIPNVTEIFDCGEKYLFKVLGFKDSYWKKSRIKIEKGK